MGERPAARVWLLPLSAAGGVTDVGRHDWLSEDEAGRLQAMTSPARRRNFLAGHWHARELAGDWLQAQPRRIALDRHDDGRPRVLVDGAPSSLSLSLSHSGDWLAIALATVPVGIDVELPRRARDLHALARFTFSAEEVGRLDGLEKTSYSAAFHRTWTLKEARGKRSGTGLLPGQSRRVTSLPSEAETAEATNWEFGEGALALAIEPGAQVDIVGGERLLAPAYWRYREDD